MPANAAALLVATRGSLLGISWWWQAVSPAPAQYSAVAFLSSPGDLAISEGVDGGRPVNATAARQHGFVLSVFDPQRPAQRGDVTVGFRQPRARGAELIMEPLLGVLAVRDQTMPMANSPT